MTDKASAGLDPQIKKRSKILSPDRSRKRIGIIGGIGPSSTIDFYTRIMNKYQEKFNDLDYPEAVIYSLSHGPFKGYEDRNEMAGYRGYLLQAIQSLVRAEAEFIAFAAISPHRVVDELQREIDLPIISALDSVARHAKNIGVKKALLLGIQFTMQSDFFQKRFERENIELVTPGLKHQEVIQNIIHGELVKSLVKAESRNKILRMVHEYNVPSVILGCYRLPVLLRGEQDGIHFIDAIDLHTSDVLNFALQ
jgi:aspartate racemase